MSGKLLRHWQIRCVGSFLEDMDADAVSTYIQEHMPQLGMFDVIPLEEEMKHAGTVEGRLGALERSERTLNRCMHEAFQRITALEGRSSLFGSWSPGEALKRAGVKVKGDEDPPRTHDHRTIEQAEAEHCNVRDRALEDAAKMVERSHGYGSMAEESTARIIAKEIREMKGK